MDALPSKVRRFSRNPWATVASMLASVGGFVLTILLGRWPSLIRDYEASPWLLPCVVLFTIASTTFLGLRIYQNAQYRRAIRRVFTKRHEISHLIREHFVHQFDAYAATKTLDQDLHSVKERETLTWILQKVAAIMRELTGRPCTADLYLTKVVDGQEFTALLTTDEPGTMRDRDGAQLFTIDEALNTNFATARRKRATETSHFCHGDLIALAKQKLYADERKKWRRFYKSRLTIPLRIRGEEIGFLDVNSPSRNRLNDPAHVEFLASLADDISLFLHLTRFCAVAQTDASVTDNKSRHTGTEG